MGDFDEPGKCGNDAARDRSNPDAIDSGYSFLNASKRGVSTNIGQDNPHVSLMERQDSRQAWRRESCGDGPARTEVYDKNDGCGRGNYRERGWDYSERDFGGRRNSASVGRASSGANDEFYVDRPTQQARGRSRFVSQGHRSHTGEWLVDRHRKDGAPPFEMPAETPYRGYGDKSANNESIRFVLILDLATSVAESILAKDLEKLYRSAENPDGAVEGSLKRIFIIRHRRTDASLGFGYAEYHSVNDAEAAVLAAKMLSKKFTIASHKVHVCFPHNGVFPHASAGNPETDPKFTFDLNGSKHKYRDDKYYPSELIVNVEAPGEATKKGEADTKPVGDTNKSSKKRKAQSAYTQPPAMLGLWQRKHSELRGEQENDEQPSKKRLAVDSTTTSALAEQTFAHDSGETKGCYLCRKVFDNLGGLIRHLDLSELHCNNLRDDAAVAAAYKLMKAKGIDSDSTIKHVSGASETVTTSSLVTTAGEQQTYRDRAAERREEEGHSDPIKVSFSLKSVNRQKAKPPADAKVKSTPFNGKGFNMLRKSGWSAGQGLGVNGSGIVTTIDQNIYAAGVGLGHQHSKQGDAAAVAAKCTKEEGFLEGTRESARKRFEKM